MENRQLTASDKESIFKYIKELNSKSSGHTPLGDDLETRDDIRTALQGCNTVGDLKGFLCHVHNFDIIDADLIGWKMLEAIFGPISYKDDPYR